MNYPRILGIGTANPPIRLTQEQSFYAAGYESERIRKIFLNSDIEYRHFFFGGTLNRKESSDQMIQEERAKSFDRRPWLCGRPSYAAAGNRFRSCKHGPSSIDAGGRDLLGLLLRR